MRFTSCLLVGVLAFGSLAPRIAAAQETRSAGAEFGLGVASVVCTVGYGIVKTAYAIAGSTIGGLAWLATARDRDQTARGIIQPAVRGDYVVTPDHLTGQRALVFFGRDPVYDPNPYQE
jgi:hypothetical protein